MKIRDRSSVWIAFCDMVLAILAVIIVAVNPPQVSKPGVETRAEYIISAEWNVDIDADVDLHMMPPSMKPVYFAEREVGCSTLDRDNRGFTDSIITLADGSKTKVDSDKETIVMRCIEPGRYDLGVNLYVYRDQSIDIKKVNLKVHVEILAINPTIHVIYSNDVYLNGVGETINWASFNLDNKGIIKLTDPPLEPITKNYVKFN